MFVFRSWENFKRPEYGLKKFKRIFQNPLRVFNVKKVFAFPGVSVKQGKREKSQWRRKEDGKRKGKIKFLFVKDLLVSQYFHVKIP